MPKNIFLCCFPCCRRSKRQQDTSKEELNSKEAQENAENADDGCCFKCLVWFLQCWPWCETDHGLSTDMSSYYPPHQTRSYDVERSPVRIPTRPYCNSPTAPSMLPYIEHVVSVVEKNDRLVFFADEKICVGTVRWTGYKTEQLSRQSLDCLLVVLLVSQSHSPSTNGKFDGQQLVRGSRDERFVLIEYSRTRPVPVFKMGDYCVVLGDDLSVSSHGGFIRKKVKDGYNFAPLNTNFAEGESLATRNCYPDYRLRLAPIPQCNEVSGPIDPIGEFHLQSFTGRNKGIQGRHNSCYLDTIIFSFFAFSNLFDDMLHESQEGKDHEYLVVINVLRYNIVYPLRACHFVSYDHIGELRQLMASRIDKRFEGETCDIPETMDALFRQLLQMEPMLSIGQSTKDQSFFDGAYTAECLSIDNERFPTSKLLFENAAVQMDFCLEKMPKCFMLQLPRGPDRDGFVLPSYKIDLKNLLYRSVKVCKRCGCNASLQFPHLMAETHDLAETFLCEDCANELQLDPTMSKELPQKDLYSVLDEVTEVEMHALICIERSHYNCYVRCGERWVFFDSMSDQQEAEDPKKPGKFETFNIPLVEEVQFKEWVTEAHESVRDRNSLEEFFRCKGLDRDQRIFRSPYSIIYRSVDPD